MEKTHVLVLQFPASSVGDYDELIAIEDLLIRDLESLGDVDGHDAGSGEMNIFVLTHDPKEAFEIAKARITACGLLSDLKAGYRLLDEERHEPLWPPTITSFDIT